MVPSQRRVGIASHCELYAGVMAPLRLGQFQDDRWNWKGSRGNCEGFDTAWLGQFQDDWWNCKGKLRTEETVMILTHNGVF